MCSKHLSWSCLPQTLSPPCLRPTVIVNCHLPANYKHESLLSTLCGSWITQKLYFLFCEPFCAHFPNYPTKSHPLSILEQSRSWEMIHGNMQQKCRMIQTWPLSPIIIPALSVRIAADCVFPGPCCVNGHVFLLLSVKTWWGSSLIIFGHRHDSHEIGERRN